MHIPSRETVSRAAFVASLALLALAWGWVSRQQGWFSHDFFCRAWQQGERELTERLIYRISHSGSRRRLSDGLPPTGFAGTAFPGRPE